MENDFCNVMPLDEKERELLDGRHKKINVLDESTDYKTKVSPSHAAEAIKSRKDINKITTYLEENGRYRDLLLFVMGINFGLRCGDLLSLKIGDVVTPEGRFVDTFRVVEEKTNKVRAMAMNHSVLNALQMYLKDRYQDDPVDRRDFLFVSESNRKRHYNPELKKKATRYEGEGGALPLAVRTVERILKEVINDKCQIPIKTSTHTLRKTFAYHFLMEAPDRNRALELLSMQLNHSSIAYTLRYIGITQDEILDTCFRLDLGLDGKGQHDSGADNVVSITDIREEKAHEIVQA